MYELCITIDHDNAGMATLCVMDSEKLTIIKLVLCMLVNNSISDKIHD